MSILMWKSSENWNSFFRRAKHYYLGSLMLKDLTHTQLPFIQLSSKKKKIVFVF